MSCKEEDMDGRCCDEIVKGGCRGWKKVRKEDAVD
jgi:hypothetical protein